MRKKYHLLLGLGLAHLVLVGFGAAKINFWDYGPAGALIEKYGLYSGTSRAFDFFAPAVGPSIRAQFDLFDTSGRYLGSDIIQKSSNRECYLRVSNIVDILSKRLEDPVLRKKMGASWAAKVLARHKEAARVQIRMENYDMPSMSQYREGLMYGWEPLFQIHFGKKKKLAYD